VQGYFHIKFKDVFEMEILIEPASRYQNRRVGGEQLDDGIGCNPSAAEAALKWALSSAAEAAPFQTRVKIRVGFEQLDDGIGWNPSAAEAAPFQNQGQAVGRHHGS